MIDPIRMSQNPSSIQRNALSSESITSQKPSSSRRGAEAQRGHFLFSVQGPEQDQGALRVQVLSQHNNRSGKPGVALRLCPSVALSLCALVPLPLACGTRRLNLSNPGLQSLPQANAPMAQLDRAPVSGTGGCRFKSCSGYQISERPFPRLETAFFFGPSWHTGQQDKGLSKDRRHSGIVEGGSICCGVMASLKSVLIPIVAFRHCYKSRKPLGFVESGDLVITHNVNRIQIIEAGEHSPH